MLNLIHYSKINFSNSECALYFRVEYVLNALFLLIELAKLIVYYAMTSLKYQFGEIRFVYYCKDVWIPNFFTWVKVLVWKITGK